VRLPVDRLREVCRQQPAEQAAVRLDRLQGSRQPGAAVVERRLRGDPAEQAVRTSTSTGRACSCAARAGDAATISAHFTPARFHALLAECAATPMWRASSDTERN